MMDKYKALVVAGGLFFVSGSVHAIIIDFKDLADNSVGESAWNTLMFDASGAITTNASNAFLDITGSNGSNSYAYFDSNNAGLGVCGKLFDASSADQANPGSRTNLCNPGSDDNVTYSSGTPERLSFVFDANVIIEKIWLNNNHDGDKSLFNDYITIGVDGANSSTRLTNGGYLLDSLLNLDLALNAGSVFDVGFNPDQSCESGGSQSQSASSTTNYNNCEFYISKIEYTTVPEPTTLALLGLGVFGLSIARRRQR